MNTETTNSVGQGVRIINMIIDMIVIIAIWLIIRISFIAFGLNYTYSEETSDQTLFSPLFTLVLIFWIYYFLTEYLSQRTLGKIFTRTKVVTENGSKPSIGQILGRTLSRSIPFEYFSFLVTVNGIHDILSKTRVIKIVKTPANKV